VNTQPQVAEELEVTQRHLQRLLARLKRYVN
jgi:DNA-binding transcriptional regulator LsrR (DeoR family)